MGDFIDPADLESFATIEAAKATEMVEDAEAMAILTAPCLADLDTDDYRRAAAKAILRAAILRWHEAGSGTMQTLSAGPFGQSAQVQSRRAMFWPIEIEQLQSLCASTGSSDAFMVDMRSELLGTSLASRPDLWFQQGVSDAT